MPLIHGRVTDATIRDSTITHTYSIAMSPTLQYAMASSRIVFHCHHSLHRASTTARQKFRSSRAIFHTTLGDSILGTSLKFLSLVLVILPLNFVESRTPPYLAYINPGTSRTHDLREKDEYFKITPSPKIGSTKGVYGDFTCYAQTMILTYHMQHL
jgi:hypothetical protein